MEDNSDCWNSRCNDCKNRKLVPMKLLNATTTLGQWENVTVEKQAKEFKADKNKKNVRVLQMHFAMPYECMYQDEVQSALWSRGSAKLFTATSISKAQSKTYLISTDSKYKDENYSCIC